jgi:predicted DsbA family dithiol-disulfide isomerase
MTTAQNKDVRSVEVWIDFVCPFSYIGEHKLKAGAALADMPIEIVYRSYQLRPDLSADTDENFISMMAARRNISVEKVKEMVGGAAAQAAEIGLQLRYELARVTNTRRAHQLAHYARTQGREDELVERIFKAYFYDGLLISDQETLLALAEDVGLDRASSAKALTDKAFEAAVEADIAAAKRAGVSSVPHFIIDKKHVISGSQSPQDFSTALLEA